MLREDYSAEADTRVLQAGVVAVLWFKRAIVDAARKKKKERKKRNITSTYIDRKRRVGLGRLGGML